MRACYAENIQTKMDPSRYKEATNTVISWIAQNSDMSVLSSKQLLLAAAAISAVPPVEIINALEFAISQRVAVRTIIFNSDMTLEGVKHEAFIRTLKKISAGFAKKAGTSYMSQFAFGAYSLASWWVAQAIVIGLFHYTELDVAIYNSVVGLIPEMNFNW